MYPFVPSLPCHIGKGAGAGLGSCSEGSAGKCWEEPAGKAQLVWWRAARSAAKGSAACWTHFGTIPNACVKGKKHEDHVHCAFHRVLLACVTHLLNFCKVYGCPWVLHTWITHRHQISTSPLTPSELHLPSLCCTSAFRADNPITNSHDTMTAVLGSHLNYRLTSCFERKLEGDCSGGGLVWFSLLKPQLWEWAVWTHFPGSSTQLQSAAGPSSVLMRTSFSLSH